MPRELDDVPEMPLLDFDEHVDVIMRDHAPFDPVMDGALAIGLHRTLPLSRRQAGDPSVWRYLSVIHRPEIVRHRWASRSLVSMKRRFWQLGTRPDSHALARLWWIAELTYLESDYSLTSALLQRPSLATGLFVRSLGWHRPLVAACVAELSGASGELTERCLMLLNRSLSTKVLESLDEETLRSLIRPTKRQAMAAS